MGNIAICIIKMLQPLATYDRYVRPLLEYGWTADNGVGTIEYFTKSSETECEMSTFSISALQDVMTLLETAGNLRKCVAICLWRRTNAEGINLEFRPFEVEGDMMVATNSIRKNLDGFPGMLDFSWYTRELLVPWKRAGHAVLCVNWKDG